MSINTPAPPGPLPADPPYPGTDPGDTLAPGRERLTRVAAAAVLTVTADAVPPARLDAGGTRLRLRALHVMGHNCVRIARALDVGETAIQELVRGDARTVS